MKTSIGRIVHCMYNSADITDPDSWDPSTGTFGPSPRVIVAAIVTLVDDVAVHVTAFPPGAAPIAMPPLPLEPSDIPQRGRWWWPPRA